MKRKIAGALLLLLMISAGAFAQDRKKSSPKFPKWVSDKGYWVVETNLGSPLNHIIRFYNNENLLLLSRSITGERLDPERKRVKMKLKKELEATVVAWQNQQQNPSKDELALQ